MLFTRIKSFKLHVILYAASISSFFCHSLLAQTNSIDNYPFITTSEYYSTAKLKKYIFVPYDIQNGSIIAQIKSSDSIFSCAISLCRDDQINELKDYIGKLKPQGNDTTAFIDLLEGIYYFFEDDYPNSILCFEKYRGVKYRFLKFLLIADSEYELLDDRFDWPEVLPYYQKAYDATDILENKKLIQDRILCIRYQK